jgi:ribosomal protein L40E
MAEALTESFCERCGTRYEFAAPTELNTLRKTRGLFSGLKNYIMSQEALGDSVNDAIRSEEEALAAQQMEAFHDSFNFCIDCRQYTCNNCWNDGAGRCRSCVPIAGTDDLLERFEATFQAQHPELAEADLQRRLEVGPWPTADLTAVRDNGDAPTEWPTAELATIPEAVPTLEPVAEPETEPVAAELEVTTHPPKLTVVAWEQDVEIALEPEPVVEPEPVAAEVEPEPIPEPEPVVEPEPVAAEVEPEPIPEPEPVVEPEPVAAEVEPEPMAPPPMPQPIRPISETILRIPPPPPPTEEERVAAAADDASLAARRAKLDLLGLGDPGEGPVGPQRGAVLPYRSSGASVHPGELAARANPQAGASFWEASAREVAGAISQVGVQECAECGLSLSASARFCRRCGTNQARSA